MADNFWLSDAQWAAIAAHLEVTAREGSRNCFLLLSKIPVDEGGILETSTPTPVFVHGQASPVLVRMLRSFQSVQKTRRKLTETEGFALRSGPTIAAMNAIIASDPANSAQQNPPTVPEVRGTWQILEMSSIRAGGPFANLLVDLLNRRKIPIAGAVGLGDIKSNRSGFDSLATPGRLPADAARAKLHARHW